MAEVKPKIAFIVGALNTSSALYNICSHICDNLQRSEGKVLLRPSLEVDDKRRLEREFDAVVYESPYAAVDVRRRVGKINLPTITFFHLIESPNMAAHNKASLDEVPPSLVLVTEDSKGKLMEEWGWKWVNVPFSFSTKRFQYLPPYPLNFTIGYMGVDHGYKHYDRVDAIAKELNIPVVGSRRPHHIDGPHAGRELEFFESISCYVVAADDESGPLPPIEALCCGRPVVTNPIGQIQYEVQRSGAGVVVKDNSPLALKSGVDLIRRNFGEYSYKARSFKLRDTSSQYEDAILTCLG